jgi:hypothetical protein
VVVGRRGKNRWGTLDERNQDILEILGVPNLTANKNGDEDDHSSIACQKLPIEHDVVCLPIIHDAKIDSAACDNDTS